MIRARLLLVRGFAARSKAPKAPKAPAKTRTKRSAPTASLQIPMQPLIAPSVSRSVSSAADAETASDVLDGADPLATNDLQGAEKDSAETPLLRDVAALQRLNPSHVLLVQVGSFFEIYDVPSAPGPAPLDRIAAILGIRIAAPKPGRKTPHRFAGFPLASSRDYISLLLREGLTVAVVQQLPRTDPSTPIKREVARIITPGTVLVDDPSDRLSENSFLLSISPDPSEFEFNSSETNSDTSQQPNQSIFNRIDDRPIEMGLAWTDVSTGEFFLAPSSSSSLELDLARIQPAEIIAPSIFKHILDPILTPILPRLAKQPHISYLPSSSFTNSNKFKNLVARNNPAKSIAMAISSKQSSDASEVDPLLKEYSVPQIYAAAGVITYVLKNFPSAEPAFQPPVATNSIPCMQIDLTTLQALEIVKSFRDRSSKGSLLGSIDYTKTGPGARLLASRLKAPSINISEINRRLDLVDAFVKAGELFVLPINSLLAKCSDIERILQRMYCNSASVSDLRDLIDTLTHAASIQSNLKPSSLNENNNLFESLDASLQSALSNLGTRLGDFSDLISKYKDFFTDEAASLSFGSGVISSGVSADLDALRKDRSDMDTEQEKLRESLVKIFGSQFSFIVDPRIGPGIEFPKPSVELISNVERLMQKKNSEIRLLVSSKPSKKHLRIRHEQWIRLHTQMVNCDERLAKLELEIFQAACSHIRAETFRLIDLAKTLAEVDVSCALAKLATDHAFVRPLIVDEPVLDVVGGRHAVVEQYANRDGRMFIKNDVRLTPFERFWILTGPNMGGKSTFLRQCAHVSILAQAGSFVPADRATIGVVDAVYSRIGASDDISANASTFMVEMRETAHILSKASPRSLVVMDEVGRGTSTLDGLALAYAIIHHLVHANKSRTLFATHYHELAHRIVTHERLASVACYQASVSYQKTSDEPNSVPRIQFLYEITRGVMDQSHGIDVAQVAGVPRAVIDMARKFYDDMEPTYHSRMKRVVSNRIQNPFVVVEQQTIQSHHEKSNFDDEVAIKI